MDMEQDAMSLGKGINSTNCDSFETGHLTLGATVRAE